MLSAIVRSFWVIYLPLCIFGLADLTVSKVFFSSLPLGKEVGHEDRAEANALACVAVLVLAVLYADRVMLVKLKKQEHNILRSENFGIVDIKRINVKNLGDLLNKVLLRRSCAFFILSNADVGP